MTAITDETLMALADGELKPAEAARVREVLRHDLQLAARFASFAESRALLSEESGTDAIPEHLVLAARRLGDALAKADQVAEPNVVSLEAAATRGARRPDRFKAMALAASIALVAGGVVGFALSGLQQRDRLASHSPMDSIAVSSPVSDLLFQLASGESRQVRSGSEAAVTDITIVSTHQMEDSSICREFTTATTGTQQTRVACLRDGAWRVHLVVISSGGAFSTASSAQTADHFLEALGTKEVLTGDAERKALARP
ncbi:hypothetical protein [Bradyrhizobium murdochi]|uniref:hypothetical protein n=1 Tax=Bradyrhizobium murdochi TaxID=1038859 RepID=UPI0004158ADA|nr:hypothetical protein [Bradyrhizobium murdochi]